MTETDKAAEKVEPTLCGDKYTRTDGLTVKCGLLAGHSGDHEDPETGTWWSAPDDVKAEMEARNVLHTSLAQCRAVEQDYTSLIRKAEAMEAVVEAAKAAAAYIVETHPQIRDAQKGWFHPSTLRLVAAVDKLATPDPAPLPDRNPHAATCPKCDAGSGHWCTDATTGRHTIHPHAERGHTPAPAAS